MDDSELQQLVIGLATQIYFANRDAKDPYDPEVTAGLSTLVEDLTFALYTEQTSADIDVPEFLRQAGLRAASGE